MKIEVNGNSYDVEVIGKKAIVNGKQIDLEIDEEDEIVIGQDHFFLDFLEEGEPSLMIVNGLSYVVTKSVLESTQVRDLKAPIGGQIIGIFASEGDSVARGQILVTLEAMKMENQVKSTVKGRIKAVRVKKGQLVKSGETLLTFE
jgi:biotin carboxyl carrier protein